jgi:GNAT superfamily N-acetyltransferase
VIVREYAPADAEACSKLFEELVETHRELYPDGVMGSEFRPEGRLFVAEDDGRIVGYTGLLLHGHRAEIEPIVVARDRRGTGVGRALAERIVQEARDLGAARVFARPVARNREAIAFFHSIGLDTLGYVHLQLDLESRERQPGETIAGHEFRV